MRRASPAVLLLVTAAVGASGCGGGAEPVAPPAVFRPAATATATPPAAPAATAATAAVPRPQPAGAVTARLTRRTALRAAPGGRVLARLGTRTEFRSPAVLAVTGRRGAWLQVLSAALPNHRRGWIPAAAATLTRTTYAIRVDRSAHAAELRRAGRVLLRFPVAVGRPGNETPLGRFAVTDALRVTDPSSPYGCCALALTGHQTKLVPGWPGGDRLAIHGTPATWSIGKAVSLGCMRAPRRALLRLMRTVPLGTPVTIRR